MDVDFDTLLVGCASVVVTGVLGARASFFRAPSCFLICGAVTTPNNQITWYESREQGTGAEVERCA